MRQSTFPAVMKELCQVTEGTMTVRCDHDNVTNGRLQLEENGSSYQR